MSAGLLIVLVIPTVAIVLTRSNRVRHVVMIATLLHIGLGLAALFAPSLLGGDGQAEVAGLAIMVYGWGFASAVFTAACTGIVFRRVFRGTREIELEASTLRSSRVGFGIAIGLDILTVGLIVLNTFAPFLEVSS